MRLTLDAAYVRCELRLRKRNFLPAFAQTRVQAVNPRGKKRDSVTYHMDRHVISGFEKRENISIQTNYYNLS